MSKISIIMANYRGEAYVEAAIDSVLRQTHHDLEILVVDDASPDASVTSYHKHGVQDARCFRPPHQIGGRPRSARRSN